MAAKRANKKAAGKTKTKTAAPKKVAPKKAALKRAAPKKVALKKAAPRKKASAKPSPAALPVAIVKKPKRPAKANPPPAVPHERTIFMPETKAPPKPKATISRAKAVALANTFLKENVGRAALYAPRTSKFRLGRIVDQDGIINVLFCHEADDFDPAITSLGAKCLEALVSAHPQLRAFEIQVQTIRM